MPRVGGKCAFKDCDATPQKNPDLSFFRFPVKDKDRCIIWIWNAGQEGFYELPDKNLENRRLCTRHFEASAFMNSEKKRLVQNAVPMPWSVTQPEMGEMDAENLHRSPEEVTEEGEEWTTSEIIQDIHNENSNSITGKDDITNEGIDDGLRQKRRKISSTPPHTSTHVTENQSNIQSVDKESSLTEFDHWAKSLAVQLNNMEISRALDLQLQIQTLVSEERIEYEDRKADCSLDYE